MTQCQDTDRDRTIIKVNSTSKAWLKLLFKLKVNVETAHVALYKCVSKNLLRILIMLEAEWQNINVLVQWCQPSGPVAQASGLGLFCGVGPQLQFSIPAWTHALAQLCPLDSAVPALPCVPDPSTCWSDIACRAALSNLEGSLRIWTVGGKGVAINIATTRSPPDFQTSPCIFYSSFCPLQLLLLSLGSCCFGPPSLSPSLAQPPPVPRLDRPAS